MLHTLNQVPDFGGWPAPENKTVPRVCITRLEGRIAQPRQDRVDAYTRETAVEQFGFLLSIPRGAVQTVFRLYLRLQLPSVSKCHKLREATDCIVVTCCYQGIVWVAES